MDQEPAAPEPVEPVVVPGDILLIDDGNIPLEAPGITNVDVDEDDEDEFVLTFGVGDDTVQKPFTSTPRPSPEPTVTPKT